MSFELLAYRMHRASRTLTPRLLFGGPMRHVHVGDGRRNASAEPLAADTSMGVAWPRIDFPEMHLYRARADQLRAFALRVNQISRDLVPFGAELEFFREVEMQSLVGGQLKPHILRDPEDPGVISGRAVFVSPFCDAEHGMNIGRPRQWSCYCANATGIPES